MKGVSRGRGLGVRAGLAALALAVWLGCGPGLAVAGGASTTDTVGWAFHVRHVESTAIDLLGYKASTQQMYVKFTTGYEYIYEGVPAQVYADFLAAPSKGQYFNASIRDFYKYTRLSRGPSRAKAAEADDY